MFRAAFLGHVIQLQNQENRKKQSFKDIFRAIDKIIRSLMKREIGF
jgi:hypothetical protein